MNNILITKKKNKGFTLLEVIVTVSIAAILVSIAVPSFKTMFKNNRITTGTNEFVAGLVLARSEALKRNNNTSLCSSSNQESCGSSTNFADGWIVFVDCNKNGNIDGNACDGQPEQIIKVHDRLQNVSVEATTPRQFMTYTFAGRSDTVTLNVKEKGKTKIEKKVIVNRTGRVRVENYL